MAAAVTTEIAPFTGLLDVQTGELLDPTIGNAARVLRACRDMKERINQIVSETTTFLADQAQHQGARTLHDGADTITLTGGPGIDYDPHDLMEALRVAGCPEERITQAVVEEISYRVNRSVLRQLAAANPDYAAAIDLAKRHIDKPVRAAVKGA